MATTNSVLESVEGRLQKSKSFLRALLNSLFIFNSSTTSIKSHFLKSKKQASHLLTFDSSNLSLSLNEFLISHDFSIAKLDQNYLFLKKLIPDVKTLERETDQMIKNVHSVITKLNTDSNKDVKHFSISCQHYEIALRDFKADKKSSTDPFLLNEALKILQLDVKQKIEMRTELVDKTIAQVKDFEATIIKRLQNIFSLLQSSNVQPQIIIFFEPIAKSFFSLNTTQEWNKISELPSDLRFPVEYFGKEDPDAQLVKNGHVSRKRSFLKGIKNVYLVLATSGYLYEYENETATTIKRVFKLNECSLASFSQLEAQLSRKGEMPICYKAATKEEADSWADELKKYVFSASLRQPDDKILREVQIHENVFDKIC